ncbi:unnamed protein product [Hyaloperonospora brassicae]|uniref:Expansin-like EG45 domain-containing protein n=1 Tax=Hyaloperonospora brassicae TaxID=162125 RepID=A0AAV0T1X9_HYABA|nr:unnamed protein product [Hyaloperonospora brassicae]
MKSSMSVVSLTTAAMLVTSTTGTYFTGDGTAYTLGDTSSGNCNMMSALDFATTDYAALNNDQWNGLENCGRCAEVTCSDSRCADKTKSVVVQILDRCPECKHGDLDLSPSVFKTLTGSHPARYTLKWKFVDCPVAGNVKYCLKGGSSSFWMAIQPTNVATGITSLEIDGKATKMLDGAYYYLLDGSGTTAGDLSNVTVSMTDLNGVSMVDTVSLSADSCTAGASQFPSSGSGSPSKPRADTPSTTPAPIRVPTPATRKMPPTTIPAALAPTAAPTQEQQTNASISSPPTPIESTAADAPSPAMTTQLFNSSDVVPTSQYSTRDNDAATPTDQQDVVSYHSGATGEDVNTPAEGSHNLRQDSSVAKENDQMQHQQENAYAEETDILGPSVVQSPSSDNQSTETAEDPYTPLPSPSTTNGGEEQTSLQHSSVPTIDSEDLTEVPDASTTTSLPVFSSEWHQPSPTTEDSALQGLRSEEKDSMSLRYEEGPTYRSQLSQMHVAKEDGSSAAPTVATAPSTTDSASDDGKTTVAQESPNSASSPETDVIQHDEVSDATVAIGSSGPVNCPM